MGDYQDMANSRIKMVQESYGYEKGLDLTFDPSRVPSPLTFHAKVNEIYKKRLRNELYSNESVHAEDKKTREREIIALRKTLSSRKKEVKFTWIPTTEIIAAQTRIDSFTKLDPKVRESLHKTFAVQVVNLMSQFESIGNLSDEKITLEQAAALKQCFSDALVEIQKSLFKPISRQLELEQRGSLVETSRKKKTREIRPSYTHTLNNVADDFLSHSEKPQKQKEDLGTFAANLEESSLLPAQYRPVPNSSLPVFSKKKFTEMTNKVRIVPAKTIVNDCKLSPLKIPPVPNISKPEILISNESLLTNDCEKIGDSDENEEESKAEIPIHISEFMTPEIRTLATCDLDVQPPVSEQDKSVQNMMKMFTTRIEEPIFEGTLQKASLVLPKIEHTKTRIEGQSYLFKPTYDSLEKLLDVTGLFVSGSGTPEAHKKLNQLWEQLDLHPDTRLLMAGKLCQLVVDDNLGAYHFKTIMSATNVLTNYNTRYSDFKMALKYEPGINGPEKREILDKMIKDYIITESSLLASNKEISHILGSELAMKKGTISEVVKKRSLKLKSIANESGISIGSIGIAYE